MAYLVLVLSRQTLQLQSFYRYGLNGLPGVGAVQTVQYRPVNRTVWAEWRT